MLLNPRRSAAKLRSSGREIIAMLPLSQRNAGAILPKQQADRRIAQYALNPAAVAALLGGAAGKTVGRSNGET